ncbi:MAG: hypothetical protein J6M27_10630 [Lachnospiraceae bacterium]|nr:hypothetical protein [Lachnospiraceae bacterium]
MIKQENSRFRYLILATATLKQGLLANVLAERFPKERGRIFLPEREYWIRKTHSIGTKPLFPGYVFAQTDMSQKELYLFVKEHCRDIQTFVNELTVKALKDSGITITDTIWSELTEEETAFLDRMLDEDGVERMSVGYKEGKRYVIVDGPLKGIEDHIIGNNQHDREAYLDVTFRDKRVVVGLEQKPKRLFSPDEMNDDHTLILSNGKEVDLKELANRMMGGSGKDDPCRK